MLAWLGDKPWRFTLWVPVLIGLGISAYFWLGSEPPAGLGWTAGMISLIALFGAAQPEGGPGRRLIQIVGLCALGFVLAMVRTGVAGAPPIAGSAKNVEVRGIVAHVIESQDKPPRIVLADVRVAHWSGDVRPGRLRLIAHKATGAWIGQSLTARADLWPPPSPVMPGAYDFGRRMFFEGIAGLGVAKSTVLEPASQVPGLEVRLARIRLTLAGYVRSRIDGQPGAVAAALITGDRSGITEKTAEDLRRSGLAHLLAISGLHMGLVVGGVLFAVRGILIIIPGLGLRIHAKKWAASAALLAGIVYLALSGASIPTVRAFVMATVMILAILLDRRSLSLRTIAVAATIVLILQPEALFEPGFQMSFAAATALIWAFEIWTDRRRDRAVERPRGLARVPGWFVAIAATSLIAAAATAPFALFHFNRVAVFGLAGNLVAMPLMGLVIMPSAVAAMVAAPLGLAELPLWAMGAGIDQALSVAARVASWEGAVVWWPVPHKAALPLIVAGGLLAVFGAGGFRLLALPAVIAGAAIWTSTIQPDVLISENGKRILFHDRTGAVRIHGSKPGAFVTERWLAAYGIDPEMPPPEWRAHPGCDADGCVFRLKGGGILALPETAAGLLQDCRLATIIVLTHDARPRHCNATVIRHRDLSAGGTHAVYLETGGPRITTVNGERGARPWRPGQ